jgi:hypothetical protein
LADAETLATMLPANAAAYLSSEVARNFPTDLIRIGGV